MSGTTERDAVLGGFDRARVEFEESLRRAPDAALRYKPPGEDYALGGLVVHVSDVLRRYTQVVGAIGQAQFGALLVPEHVTPAEDAVRIGAGFDGAARGPVVEEMRAAHTALVDAIRLSVADDFSRQAAVTYGGASAPYPTSFADIVGWVADHYREHTQQIADLVSAWAQATR